MLLLVAPAYDLLAACTMSLACQDLLHIPVLVAARSVEVTILLAKCQDYEKQVHDCEIRHRRRKATHHELSGGAHAGLRKVAEWVGHECSARAAGPNGGEVGFQGCCREIIDPGNI